MQKVSVIFFIFTFVNNALLQGTGSGTNGNLRLCVVEGRGAYKRTFKYCPVLDKEDSGVECVLGTDRLDCLRRISKGTVDFGAFSPEDLMAAQWANIDVLVTNELRSRSKPFERSVVAVVNRRILTEERLPIRATLKNSTLCHPGADVDDLRPLSDTLSAYLEFQVLSRDCIDELSLAENRIKALADFFGSSCKAGPWVVDKNRDAQLKRQYSSLCSACGSPSCSANDRYWGSTGSLACLVEVGDVAWAELVDVKAYFGLHETTGKSLYPAADKYAFLCRDGSWQALDSAEPCVWLQRPWPVIVAKRKASEAVAKLALSLHNNTVTVDPHWRGALAALLEIRQAQPEPLQPPVTPFDYLARAKGFREAYSQTGCVPSRHITFCTTSLLEKNKCEWLSEAGSVYGIAPSIQCAMRNDTEACIEAVANGECHVVQADSNWLMKAERDHNLVPVLHEATPIVEKTHTVVAYVRPDSGINKMADLRGKRAAFPEYDGVAWHSAIRYLKSSSKLSCGGVKEYFSEICAPGISSNITDSANVFKKSCYEEGLSGEMQALKSLVEGRSDVAFISMETYNTYAAKLIPQSWASQPLSLKPVCPDNNKYCLISWSNLGHIFAPKNITAMRHQEIVNVFTKLDQLFGKHYPFHNPMFAMYGPFNHKLDVLFHNSTKNLITDESLKSHPYNRIPMNFERSLSNSTDSCQAEDLLNFGTKIQPGFLVIMVSLVVYLIS
ncbi:hypothetical protein ABMA27_012626 [Loxostege sticticalis]|uniref:Transferrin-like domain-containing protein n=1 Tax=Loxostege sticticalis TaxID=481309 RepID=A0ABR3GZQ8_LOXSC